MTAVTWLTGKDWITTHVGGTAFGVADTTLVLTAGDGALLPAAPFYLFFIGNAATGENPEYIFVSAKVSDTLTISAPPFGNTTGTGRAALRPDIYPAGTHPIGATIQLRSTWEHILQIQTVINTHNHEGTTGNGPILDAGVAIQDATVSTAKLVNGAATGVKLGSDVITVTGTQSITGLKTITSPIITSPTINLTGDATGDMYYRSIGGGVARVAAPASGDRGDYMLAVDSSGVVAWGPPQRRYTRAMLLSGV